MYECASHAHLPVGGGARRAGAQQKHKHTRLISMSVRGTCSPWATGPVRTAAPPSRCSSCSCSSCSCSSCCRRSPRGASRRSTPPKPTWTMSSGTTGGSGASTTTVSSTGSERCITRAPRRVRARAPRTGPCASDPSVPASTPRCTRIRYKACCAVCDAMARVCVYGGNTYRLLEEFRVRHIPPASLVCPRSTELRDTHRAATEIYALSSWFDFFNALELNGVSFLFIFGCMT